MNYAGKKHSKTGVRYDKKGFPVFDSKHDVKLPKKLHKASDHRQMRYSTKNLQRKLKRNPELRKQFSEKALRDIDNGEARISDYTWHHHQDTGKMQLVDRKAHGSTKPHVGGKKIWGGGKEKR